MIQFDSSSVGSASYRAVVHSAARGVKQLTVSFQSFKIVFFRPRPWQFEI